MNKKREEKIVDSISTEGFEYKNIRYKTLTTRMLLLMEKFKSPFYTGGDQLKGLMDYLYLGSGDLKKIQSMSKEEFDDAVYEFSDKFTALDLEELGRQVNSFVDNASATLVEVREGSDEKKS